MITPLLADAVHDYWEINSFKAAVFGAICTGLWAVWQWQKDYRWRQVELARKLLDDIFDYPPSDDAWKMVDGETSFNDSEEHEEEGKIKITMADVKRALKVTVADDKRTLPDSKNDDELRKDKYVRWCFDALFYYLERLEQSIEINIVRFDDLKSPASYYIALMAGEKKLCQDYAEFIRFHGAVAFMERFPEWNKVA